MSESAVTRVSRGKHWVIGPYVIVELRSWDGEKGRHTTKRCLFPKDQSRHQKHPRAPGGYDPATGEFNSCVSRSYSGYDDLCKYGEFRWGSR